MAPTGRDDDEPAGPTGRFADDLLGLDPQHPEVREFVAHRDHWDRPHSPPTVEGMLHGVDEFARGANRTEGHRRVVVLTVVVLVLLGLIFAIWDALVPDTPPGASAPHPEHASEATAARSAR